MPPFSIPANYPVPGNDLFTDSLTLKLAVQHSSAACTWHGLSPLAHIILNSQALLAQLYFAFRPPSDHHQRHACRALQRNITTVKTFTVQSAAFNVHTCARLHCTAPSCTISWMQPYFPFSTRGAPLGSRPAPMQQLLSFLR